MKWADTLKRLDLIQTVVVVNVSMRDCYIHFCFVSFDTKNHKSNKTHFVNFGLDSIDPRLSTRSRVNGQQYVALTGNTER